MSNPAEESAESAADGAAWQQEAETITIEDGTGLTIRPIRPGDAPALQRFHSRLSERSIMRRFFQMVRILDEERAAYFTTLDHVMRHAVVALDPDTPDEIVGVVRYDREEGTTEAEYAIVIADQWQHRGLGHCLTLRLIGDALAGGVEYFYALVLPENRPMLKLFHHLNLPVRERRHPDGVVQVTIDLRPAHNLSLDPTDLDFSNLRPA